MIFPLIGWECIGTAPKQYVRYRLPSMQIRPFPPQTRRRSSFPICSYLHRVPPLWKGSSKTGPLVAYRPYCVPLTVFDCHGKYRRALSEQDTQHCRHYNIRWSLHTRRDGGSRDRIVPDRRWEVHEDGSRASQTRIRGDQGVHGSKRIGEHQGTREVPALCEIEAESSRSTQLGALLCNPELEICNR